MDQNGHCLCAEHVERYRPRNIRPAWYIAPEHLNTTLFCGRCAGAGKRIQGGLVLGGGRYQERTRTVCQSSSILAQRRGTEAKGAHPVQDRRGGLTSPLQINLADVHG